MRELNRAWRERRFEALYGFFRDDVVMAVPGRHEALVGVEAMVDSYRQFDAACKVHAFDIIAIDVFMREHMCICHVRFGVDYETDKGRRVETGMEVYVIDTSGTTPRIAWRTQMPLPNADDTTAT